MSASGLSVLVTRPEPGASATAARLTEAGYLPIVTPLLHIRRCRVPLPPASRLQAVIAASGNAIELPRAYHGLTLLAVGDATAARARAHGFATVHSADGDADALATLAGRLLSPAAGALLLATARGEGTRLAAALRARGFTVHRRAVYAASPLRKMPSAAIVAFQQGLHAALFFSAATARAFVLGMPDALRPFLSRTIAVAIGPAAAEWLAHLPWRELRVALRPTQDEVLAQL